MEEYKVSYAENMNKTMLNKQVNRDMIDELKNNTQAFSSFLKNQNDGTTTYILEKMGRLENSYMKEPLVNLLNNQNENIRALSVKNLAKMSDISLLPIFIKYASQDESTEVRREAVSAVGRLRNEKAIPTLIRFLTDNDPKVVMQAIRGLLVFADRLDVKQELKKLFNHPNELIKEIINKEVNGFSYKSNSLQKHDEHYSFLRNTIVQGDVQEALRIVPDESIHLTFTSPLYYNARDYLIYQNI